MVRQQPCREVAAAHVAHLARDLELAKGGHGRLDIRRAYPAPLGAVLRGDRRVQLDQVDVFAAQTLQAALNRCDDGRLDGAGHGLRHRAGARLNQDTANGPTAKAER